MTKRAKPARRKPANASSARPKGREYWWGPGDPPLDLWPGVTISIATTWSSARRRWESHDGRYFFDAKAADIACNFFPMLLTHHIGEFAGQPFELLDYQKKLLSRPLFGWKRLSDGLRRFRKVFAFLPKGAGKSPWGAGTGIFLARLDGEAAAEVYAVAADRKQGRVVHDHAKIMVLQSEDLHDGCEITKDAIVWTDSHSKYEVLSADAATKHGFRPHGVIFDEFHAQPDRDLYEALKRSMPKRRQPVMIIVTHAGTDDEGVCYEEYELAKRVLRGAVNDESSLPVIFEADPTDDWTDPAVWRRVNPGHGITVKHDGIAAECAEAMAEPRKLNDFLRYQLNRWVNQATAWIPLDWWDACDGSALQDAELSSLTCSAGLDLAEKWDLACFSIVFRHALVDAGTTVELVLETETGEVVTTPTTLNYRISIVPFFWIPENTMREHERLDGVPYSLWVNTGLVTATEGDIIDYNRIYRDITTKILPRFPKLKEGVLGYDPKGATSLITDLRDRGGLRVQEVLQNYKHLSEPAQMFEALVKGRRVAHGGNLVLRDHIGNVAVKKDDAGRIRPTKPKKTSKKRIDGVAATVMAIKVLETVQTVPPVSKYDRPGSGLVTIGGN